MSSNPTWNKLPRARIRFTRRSRHISRSDSCENVVSSSKENMKPFKRHTGRVATLDRVNVDTDQIIPKQVLKRIERSGFGRFLFYDWKFNPDGSLKADFELNQARFEGASLLLARANFGCGSSREHAPWALLDYGFRSIIAPSFADIFYNNCFKNGMLPVRLSEDQIEQLFQRASSNP